MGRRNTRTWGPYDTALWHTCAVLAAVRTGRPDELPEIGAPFAMQLGGADEQIFGTAAMVLSTFDSPGDGTYYRSGGLFMATGKGGIALTAGVAGVQAIRNASKRRQAHTAAQPRWLPADHGLIHVGSHGFYLQTPTAFHARDRGSVHSAQVIDIGRTWLQGRSERGPISWIIDSHFAEMTFLLSATACNPRHPQLIDRSWLPPHWMPWAATHRYPPPQIPQ